MLGRLFRCSLLLALVASLSACLATPGMFVGANNEGNQKWVFLSPKQSAATATQTPEPIGVAPTITFKIIPISAESVLSSVLQTVTHTLPPSAADSGVHAYKIGAQDILRVDVWGHPDLGSGIPTSAVNSSMPATGRVVDEAGNIFIPLMGVLRAAGLTASELRTQIAAGLAKYIRDPQVEVSITAYRSKRVLVSGEVKVPGLLPLTDVPLRLSEAIVHAGGTTLEADLSQVALVRSGVRYSVNLHRVLYNGDLAANLVLLPGDSLSVPDRSARKVFVLGELLQPKTQLLRYGKVSLAEVLSDAGGLNPLTANGGEVFVIRSDDQQGALVYQLNAREPAALVLADRFEIRPRDTVYINPTNLTRIGRVVSQLLPTLTGASAVRSISGN